MSEWIESLKKHGEEKFHQGCFNGYGWSVFGRLCHPSLEDDKEDVNSSLPSTIEKIIKVQERTCLY